MALFVFSPVIISPFSERTEHAIIARGDCAYNYIIVHHLHHRTPPPPPPPPPQELHTARSVVGGVTEQAVARRLPEQDLQVWEVPDLEAEETYPGFPQTFCDKIPGLFKDFSRTKYVFSRTLMCYKLKYFCSQVTKN